MTRVESLLRSDPTTLSPALQVFRENMLREIEKSGKTVDEFCRELTPKAEEDAFAFAERFAFQNRLSRPAGIK